MIVVHRLTHPNEPLYLNPDQIQMVEAHPDTVVALANASKFVVRETPEQVADRIREWRASILVAALTSPQLASLPGVPECALLAPAA